MWNYFELLVKHGCKLSDRNVEGKNSIDIAL